MHTWFRRRSMKLGARASRRSVWALSKTPLGLAAAVTLIAASAEAHCPALTVKPPDGWEEASSGCFRGVPGDKALPIYWKNQCVSYNLQRDASAKVSLADATAIVAEAFATWSSANCLGGGHPSITATDLGPVECKLVEYNDAGPNQNVIVFRDDGWASQDPSSTLGLTHNQVDLDTGEMYGADMELNTYQHDFVASGPVPPGQFDLRVVITHEVGHFLGLGHSEYADAMMFAHYGARDMGLSADDEAGICALYPPDGSRITQSGTVASSACNTTPRHGFSSTCGSLPGAVAVDDASGSPVHHSGCSMTRSSAALVSSASSSSSERSALIGVLLMAGLRAVRAIRGRGRSVVASGTR